MTFVAHCWHNRLTRSIRSCLKLYNVGTGSCAESPRGPDLQDGAMNIAPCTGTGSQVTMTTVVKVNVWLHTVAQTISLAIAALWSKLWAGGALGSHGGSVLWCQRGEGGLVSVPQAATDHQQTPVEVHKGKAVMKLLCVCWHVGSLADSVLLFYASAERPARPPAVPAVSGGCERRSAPTKQPERRQHPHRRSLPAPLQPSPQTAVAFWAASCS